MLTPEEFAVYPDSIVQMYAELEAFVIDYFALSLKVSVDEGVNPTAEWRLKKLQMMGADLKEIEKKAAQVTEIALVEIEEVFAEANLRSYEQQAHVYELAGQKLPTFADETYQQIIRASVKSTKDEFVNFSQSLGMNNSPLKDFYNNTLDMAHLQVSSGIMSPTQAIKSAVNKLKASGVEKVTFESGYRNNIEVAARRAVMAGLHQSTSQITEMNLELMGTDIVEVSAHEGARDTGTGAANHKEWQGKWYSRSGKSDKYPSLVAVTGYGTGEGLCGWNCRHSFYGVIDGISTPTRTKEQLKNIDPPDFEYEGKTYNHYAATQKMRQIEYSIRCSRREQVAYKAIAQEDFYRAAVARERELKALYSDFASKAGLKLQPERWNVIKRE